MEVLGIAPMISVGFDCQVLDFLHSHGGNCSSSGVKRCGGAVLSVYTDVQSGSFTAGL